MTARASSLRPAGSATAPTGGSAYLAGRCNIGPAEIARRRRFGHLGLAATVALLAVLLVLGVPREWRLLIFLPAAGGAVGYLQAHLRFCAAFGLLGVFNFGRPGSRQRVADPEALRRDQLRALAIAGASGLAGLATALLAYLI